LVLSGAALNFIESCSTTRNNTRRRISKIANASLLRHLIRPIRGGAAGVLIVFSLLLAIAAHAGLLGIPLAFILISWFFKYAYILFDHTVWGFDEPPALDIQMLNPVDEQRPLAQVLILGLIYAAVKLAGTRLGAGVATCLAAAAALLLPASIAVLGLERNILKALSPMALVRMIQGLGMVYPAVLALIACGLVGAALLERLDLWLPLQVGIAMLVVLSMFSVLGGALYERRNELGLETRRSPEHAMERQRREDLRQSEAMVTHAYGQMRAGSHAKAWEELQGWLASRGDSPADYRWLCDRLSAWHDTRYPNRLTEEHVEKLLRLRHDGQALDAVVYRLRQDPSFRPKTAAATLRIATLAAQGGGARSAARTLLSDFATRFKEDPNVAAAETLAKQLAD
jgi:hypothetical protein